MSSDIPATEESSSALTRAGSYCSVVGFVAVVVLQRFELSNWTLLFWWIITAMIALAAISACFTPPSLLLRAVFAFVFVAQLPAFNWAWSEIYERDTVTKIRFDVGFGEPSAFNPTGEPEERTIEEELKRKAEERLKEKNEELERKNQELESKNSNLEWRWRNTLLFWGGIGHLTGMGFALLGCTAGGQRRIRIVYEDG